MANQTIQAIQYTDMMLSKAFIDATTQYKDCNLKDNTTLQAVVKQYGQPLINSLMASGSTNKEAVGFIRVLLSTQNIDMSK